MLAGHSRAYSDRSFQRGPVVQYSKVGNAVADLVVIGIVTPVPAHSLHLRKGNGAYAKLFRILTVAQNCQQVLKCRYPRLDSAISVKHIEHGRATVPVF